MWQTNIRVLLVGVLTIGFYTMVARIIPQVEAAVPEALDLSGGVTPEALISAGEGLYRGAGCTSCHGLGTRAPNLVTDYGGEGPIGQRCGNRQAGMGCKEYLYESMVDPMAYLVEGYPGIMPDASRQLADDQIWAVVAYLESNGGTVTVTAADIQTSEPAAPATAAPAGGFSASMDPQELLLTNACIGCHAMDGSGAPIGPSFDGIGSRLTPEQIRESILDPTAEVSEGFEQMGGLMPADFGQKLSAAQLEVLVEFLVARK